MIYNLFPSSKVGIEKRVRQTWTDVGANKSKNVCHRTNKQQIKR